MPPFHVRGIGGDQMPAGRFRANHRCHSPPQSNPRRIPQSMRRFRIGGSPRIRPGGRRQNCLEVCWEPSSPAMRNPGWPGEHPPSRDARAVADGAHNHKTRCALRDWIARNPQSRRGAFHRLQKPSADRMRPISAMLPETPRTDVPSPCFRSKERPDRCLSSPDRFEADSVRDRARAKGPHCSKEESRKLMAGG